MFVQGKIYRRRDLHSQFGGQSQGGISTPARHNLILIFTGEQGEQYGYSDGWDSEGMFLYTGEGQHGDMQFVRGNRAIPNHAQDGKDMHLFSYTNQRGFVRYTGQMVYTGHHHRVAPDLDNNMRRAIVFELTPIEDFAEFAEQSRQDGTDGELDGLPLEELRERALASSSQVTTASERKALVRTRSRAIKLYVLVRSRGTCEGCNQPAPFRTPQGQAYLEPHNIRRLSDGGPDDPRWVIAICPNCHRRAHYSEDADIFNDRLAEVVGGLEGDES